MNKAQEKTTAMETKEFLQTVYLGDRACKAILVDTWNSSVRVQVDCISRIRSPDGRWDYYRDEDIKDGFLVFTEVQQFDLLNSGHLPNDSINGIDVLAETDGLAIIEVSIDSVDGNGKHHDTLVRLKCRAVHLEDPVQAGVRIAV